MRKLEIAGAVLGAAALFGTVGLACGDKLLVIGRGVRFQHAYAPHQGSLLIYSSGTQSGATLRSAKLQTTLKQAGHKLQTVEGASQLDGALKSGKVDVVLADFADLAGIARQLQSSPATRLCEPACEVTATGFYEGRGEDSGTQYDEDRVSRFDELTPRAAPAGGRTPRGKNAPAVAVAQSEAR